MLNATIYAKFLQKIILTSMGVSLLLVSGCGKSFEGKAIGFGSYTMQISTVFEETDVSNFENKRTKDHLIKAYIYKLPPESTDLFEKNITIGVIQNDQNINTDAFSKISIQKIQNIFQKYQQLGLYKRSFVCTTPQGRKKISYYIHSYSFDKAVDNQTSKTYYLSQAQRATNGFLYTISASSDIETDIDKYESYMKTLDCVGA